MERIITDNAVEKITVVTDETHFSLKHKINGPWTSAQQTNVTVLNKREAEQVHIILNNWLKNNVDNSLDKE